MNKGKGRRGEKDKITLCAINNRELLTLGKRGKLVVIGAGVMMVVIFLVAWQRSLVESGEIPKEVKVSISDVKVKSFDADNNRITITISFGISNNTDRIVTVSKIDYEVIADGAELGRSFLSYEDVPLVGRPPILTRQTTILDSDFTFSYSDDIKDTWNKLLRGDADNVEWNIKGSADIETAFSIIPVAFDERL